MTKSLSPLRAIRAHCRICNGETTTGGHHYDCLDHNCTLYPFKKGKGVYEGDTEKYVSQEHKDWLKSNGLVAKSSRELSDEQKQKASDRMKRAWETRRANQSHV